MDRSWTGGGASLSARPESSAGPPSASRTSRSVEPVAADPRNAATCSTSPAKPCAGLSWTAVVGERTRQAVSSSVPGRALAERLPPGVDNRGAFGNDSGMTVARIRRRPCPPPPAGGQPVSISQASVHLSLSLYKNRARIAAGRLTTSDPRGRPPSTVVRRRRRARGHACPGPERLTSRPATPGIGPPFLLGQSRVAPPRRIAGRRPPGCRRRPGPRPGTGTRPGEFSHD